MPRQGATVNATQKTPRQRPLYIQPVGDRSIDDDDERSEEAPRPKGAKPAEPANQATKKKPAKTSSTSIDRAPLSLRDAILMTYLSREGVRGAAGLIFHHGARKVLDVVYDMIDYDAAQNRWVITRFRNAGAFLTWSLVKGGYRRKVFSSVHAERADLRRAYVEQRINAGLYARTAREQFMARHHEMFA